MIELGQIWILALSWTAPSSLDYKTQAVIFTLQRRPTRLCEKAPLDVALGINLVTREQVPPESKPKETNNRKLLIKD